MRLPMAFLVATVATLAGGGARAAASVEVKDAVARVTVMPENRADVVVEVTRANPKLPITVRTLLGRTIVAGGLGPKIRGCNGIGENVVVRVRGLGDVTWNDMPTILIRTPRDVNIDIGGAIWGSIGRASSVKLGNAGCGDWTVANVEGSMQISQAGSGDTRTGAAGSARFRVAGSGDVAAGEIKGPLVVDVAGSGDVTVASVSGPLKIHVAGSGGVKVDSGHATTMKVAVAGSGNVNFGGVADSLKASIAGPGGIRARQVTGKVAKSVVGSGRVTVGN